MNAEKFLRVNDRTVQSTLGGMIEDGLEFLRCNGLNGESLAFAQEQHVFQSGKGAEFSKGDWPGKLGFYRFLRVRTRLETPHDSTGRIPGVGDPPGPLWGTVPVLGPSWSSWSSW